MPKLLKTQPMTAVNAKLTLKQFLQVIYDVNSTIQLKHSSWIKMNNLYHGFIGIDKKALTPEFCKVTKSALGIFVLSHIIATHTMMLGIDDEQALTKLLMTRTDLLAKQLRIAFQDLQNSDDPAKMAMSAEDFALLHESLFISTKLSFDKQQIKNYLYDYYLLGAYIKNAAIEIFQEKVRQNLELYFCTLTTVISDKAVVQSSYASIKSFFDNLLQEYKNNTVAIPATSTLLPGLLIGAGLFIVGNYLFDAGFYSLLAAPIGYGIVKWQKQQQLKKPRILTPVMVDHYLTIAARKNQHEKPDSTIKQRAIQIKQKAKNNKVKAREQSAAKHYSQQYKESLVNDMIINKFKNLSQLRWQLPLFRDELNQSSNNLKQNLFYSLNYNRDEATTTSFSQVQLDDACDLYKSSKVKKSLTKSKTDHPGDKVTTAVAQKSSYENISYILPASHQDKGVLVTDAHSGSKAFFAYSDKANQHQMQQASKFIAKNGEFGGFKYMNNLQQYELKLFDETRVCYKKTNTAITVEDSLGQPHQVPCWEAVMRYKK